ncbi:MAG: hypothetical protein KH135_00740 [Firmicutes bacterium]|nr:hypothetical protein [Bacillota bacterium]
MIKIHLGGTCNNSIWRDELVKMLDLENVICLNPICKDWVWNEKKRNEKSTRLKMCDYFVYVITPETYGFASIATLVDLSNKCSEKVIACILYEYKNMKFEGHMLESIKSVSDIIKDNGVILLNDLNEIASFINNKAK